LLILKGRRRKAQKMGKQKKFGLHGHNMGTVDLKELSECGGFDLQVIDFISAPGKIRTCGLRIRSPLLYPAELRARGSHYNGFFA
jgi:hypothetical protein